MKLVPETTGGQSTAHQTSVVAGPDAQPTKRLWLHTCDFDSPAALPFYKKAGFRVFEETDGPEAYPEEFITRHRSAAG